MNRPEHPLDSLLPYLEGELAGAAAEDVEEHLRECAACVGELRSLRHTVEALERHLTVSAPAGFLEQLNDAIARDERLSRLETLRRHRSRPWRDAGRRLASVSAGGVVVAVATALGVASLGLHLRSDPEATLAVEETVAVPVGGDLETVGTVPATVDPRPEDPSLSWEMPSGSRGSTLETLDQMGDGLVVEHEDDHVILTIPGSEVSRVAGELDLDAPADPVDDPTRVILRFDPS